MKSSNDLTRNVLLDQLCDSLETMFSCAPSPALFLIVTDAESRARATERAGLPNYGIKYMLMIDIGDDPDSQDDIGRQIDTIMEELKSHGLTAEEIEGLIADQEEDD